MVHNLIKDIEIVLGSSSQRRKELLEKIGVKPKIIAVEADEIMSGKAPEVLAVENAEEKNRIVRKRYAGNGVVVTADTIVLAGKTILGKPRSEKEAREFLRLLSDSWHKVITGMTIYNPAAGKQISRYEVTKVHFREIDEEEIREYIETGEPFDKAGAYGIQGYASQFVDKIEGCYFNVVGFPVSLFYSMLKECLNV